MAFHINKTVGSYDIDTNCNATPTSTMRYLMEAVDSNLLTCGPSYQDLMERGLSFIVSRTAVKIIRPLKEYEDFTVFTWATESKTVTFPRSFCIKVGDETVAEAVTLWALVDTKENQFIKGSDFDVSCYGTEQILDIGMPTRFKIPADTLFKKCGETEVLYSYIDKNFHMNNTKYFDMLFDRIPNRENYYMSSCLLNYVSEAPYGSKIEIFISEPFTENGETCYYFKTEIAGNINIQAKVGVSVEK